MGVQCVHKCILKFGVEIAPHKLLQLVWLQHLVAASRLLKYVVYMAHQRWLFFRIRQSVYSEVLLQLTLAVGVRLYGNGPQVYQFQYACRQQIVVVVGTPLICVQHVVGLLQISVQRYVAIPQQVLVHTLASAPLAYSAPYAAHYRPHKQAHHEYKSEERLRIAPVHLLVAIVHVVTALKGLALLLLKGHVLHHVRLELTHGELHHHVQSSLAAHRPVGGLGHHHTTFKPHLTVKPESPHVAAIGIKHHCRVLAHYGHLGMVRFRVHALVQEYVAYGVSVRISAHQSRHRICGHVCSLAALAQAPAYLVSALGAHYAALHRLPRSVLVYIPVHVQKSRTAFVSHLQVAYLALAHVSQTDVALSALTVYTHQSGFGYARVAVSAQHHLYIQVM